ncbi:hypothetical protein MCOR27_004981 [Pyricularia oryzae]|uniref:Uncharacterized protein n=1 Tax=Pyricularia grisea TaxID=148305 RepID=A0ABQ8NSV6_PYRGI|nr:hypothetical protein MCOR01_009472 [Pyricularia oryzae]KAI6301580.1 hypothetical protein MCOR33_002976 [Pyricularia grisea]KAH9437266.1 hypothetical protein MCOR02_000921 [Pyricularia oryzae]KAI6258451.1 hypothetical protein MCOR19_005181 [Pyricularia oryzae]KAI6268781.1 hypothetical protein MCOR26_009023 [Pyricularia oryzae]
MLFGKISQFVALAVLGGTALAQSPTGNNDAGPAARDVNGDKVLSRRDSRGAYYPTGPSQPPQPIWTQGGGGGGGDGGGGNDDEESAGRTSRNKRIRARQVAVEWRS